VLHCAGESLWQNFGPTHEHGGVDRVSLSNLTVQKTTTMYAPFASSELLSGVDEDDESASPLANPARFNSTYQYLNKEVY
jgi:hypothetical protein